MAHYVILKCDLSKPHDVVIGRRVNRSAARRIAKLMNAEAIKKAGGDPRKAPLYYCVRADHIGDKDPGKEYR